MAKEIEKGGGQAFPIKADVVKAKEVFLMVERVVEKYGKVDILVNNAGVLRPTKIEDIKEEEWDLVIDVNLKGTFNCSKAVLPSMKKRGGKIVNISSSAGRSFSTLGSSLYGSEGRNPWFYSIYGQRKRSLRN